MFGSCHRLRYLERQKKRFEAKRRAGPNAARLLPNRKITSRKKRAGVNVTPFRNPAKTSPERAQT